ncbi:MAG: PilZ domain-containing protein [Halobacteriovoraceae bacterium]|jgi:hypothetical protein|nr:PilZ domain-containing protein [Halobacteriovoraceae bacterium]
MLKRPLILKLFALFLFIDPLLRITFIAIEREFPFWVVLTKTFALGPADFFNFWFLFPVSGILLLSVKLYSYLVFITIQLYSIYFHLNYEPYSWPYLSESPSITSYLLLATNVMMMFYLLLPRSREIFFNKNLRWWERGSRYTINETCFAKVLDREIHGTVCDLSFGGALLKLDEPIDAGSIIRLDFEILHKPVSISAQIVRSFDSEEGLRFGTQFLFEGTWQKLRLKLLMLSLAKLSDYDKFR